MTVVFVPCYAQKKYLLPWPQGHCSENRISGKSHMQVQQQKIIDFLRPET